MKRRSFLRFLGAAPIAGVVTVAGCSAPALASGGLVSQRRKQLVGEVPSEQVISREVDKRLRAYETRRIRA